MEIEKEALDKILNSSVDFKRLYVEHSELKLKIGNMNKSKFLTAEEEVEKKRNQKQKLILKDKMEAILSQAR
tara:strand:- start:62 stop:277 length:216 start_codon:yes stop_codon:yes gene_type:complete